MNEQIVSPELNGYIKNIERLDIEDSVELINNSTIDHAIPLIAKLVARGRREVLILTGSLNPKIYTDRSVMDALGVFLLGRSGALKIVVQKSVEDVPDDEIATSEAGLVRRLKHQFGSSIVDRVSVSRASEPVRMGVKCHFLVVDDKGFRYEPNHDRPEHVAVACFNMPDVAKKLKETFEAFVKTSQPIALS